jgi:hypothetical protein
MNDDEKLLANELIKIREELNTRITKLMILVSIVFCVNIASQTIENVSHDRAVEEICRSNSAMMEKVVEDYFITDYDYGEINQTTDVKVGN